LVSSIGHAGITLPVNLVSVLFQGDLLTAPNADQPAVRSDRSPWNWLLLLPIIVPLLPFLFNADEPRLLGFPLFYWLQFAFIALGVTSTTIVYRMTRRRNGR
jgi:hypothetical protein